MDNAWRARVDERLGALEHGFTELKASVDVLREAITGLKFSLQGTWAFMAIGFAAMFALCWQTLSAVGSLRTEMAAEARATRSEIHTDTSAQVSAIANAITATKQQAPQVLLVPTPLPDQHPKP